MVDRISPEGLMMTRDQRELVRLSLDRLSEEADPVTLLLYRKLFELDSSVRRLLHNDLTAQCGKLMDTRRRRKLARPLRVLTSSPGQARTPARQLRRPAGSLRRLDHGSALGAGHGFRGSHPRGLEAGPGLP